MVLLDALMPGMDGFEVARRLKANAATAPIPIIFMTGLTEIEHVVAAFAAGGAKSVTKPIRAQEMLARVVEAMVQALKLTLREAELLCWLGKGKTNRDIGDILGKSLATVKKHLMHVYVKLSIETRTATAGLAMTRLQR